MKTNQPSLNPSRRPIKFINSILFMFFLLFLASCDEKQEQGDEDIAKICVNCGPGYFSMQAMPQNAKYPVADSIIENWVSTRQGHKTREHAWNLFADLMQTVDDPKRGSIWRWRSWPTATQAYYTGSQDQSQVKKIQKKQHSTLLQVNKSNIHDSINLPAPGYQVPAAVCKIISADSTGMNGCTVPINGCEFQNNGDILIAGVIYNKPAFDHIRDNKLYDWNNLVSLWTNSYKNENWKERTIPSFPETAIVLKPMLWPVKQSGYTPLPVFPLECYSTTQDCDVINGELAYSGFEEQRVWKDAVAITAQAVGSDSVVSSIDFLYDVYRSDSYKEKLGPNTYTNVPVHSINEFYHWQVSEEEWNAMSCVDQAIISQSSYWAYNKPFEPGDYLVLVAMHVITKEMPSWTLQSFWWDNTPQAQSNNVKFNHQRNTVANPPMPEAFNSYLMTSTYGMNAQNTVPSEWPLAFNPYIELAAAHPINTNCRNCHMRGAFPNKKYRETVGLSLPNFASYLNPYFPNPTALDTFNFSNNVLDSLLLMDFQWAISDRVIPPDDSEK